MLQKQEQAPKCGAARRKRRRRRTLFMFTIKVTQCGNSEVYTAAQQKETHHKSMEMASMNRNYIASSHPRNMQT
jgi:hypothetical protein